MAAILGTPSNGKKGVVVLTHNEAVVIERKGKHLLHGVLKSRDASELRMIRRRIQDLKKNFLFGCHFNYRNKTLVLPASKGLFDFYLSTKKTYSIFLPESKRVNTVASFFVPDNYKLDLERDIDILYVATDSKNKNWDRFLHVCEQLLRERPGLHLMAIQTGHKELSSNHSQMNELISKFPQANLDFRYIRLSGPGKGLPKHEIRALMNRAKVFTHFSEMEGQATVLSEAFMAGCKVGLYRQLYETSVELPSTKNWMLYTQGREAEVILSLLESNTSIPSDMDRVMEFFGEKSNIELLSLGIERIVAPVVPNFVDLENLKHRLPAHTYQGVKWDKEIEHKPFAALQNLSEVKSFLDFLEKSNVPS